MLGVSNANGLATTHHTAPVVHIYETLLALCLRFPRHQAPLSADDGPDALPLPGSTTEPGGLTQIHT